MIKIENLNKNFKDGKNTIKALIDINLEIQEGETIILKGRSGSGKSTLLSILSAMQKPTSGDVIVNNLHIAKLPDIHASKYRLENIGMVFQSFELIEGLSVKENILLALVPSKTSQKDADKKVDEIIDILDIKDKKHGNISNLSGGEKQRCAIARALINSPSIILCDEPTANLDLDNSKIFLKIIERLSNEGKTIIIATHDNIFDELTIINRVIKMEKSKIIDE